MDIQEFMQWLPSIMSAATTLMGILVSNRLTNYRIEQLEKKVDQHNHLVERMTKVEQNCKSAHKRLDKIE